jgi:hypothetical protein
MRTSPRPSMRWAPVTAETATCWRRPSATSTVSTNRETSPSSRTCWAGASRSRPKS